MMGMHSEKHVGQLSFFGSIKDNIQTVVHAKQILCPGAMLPCLSANLSLYKDHKE